uniref:Uncharacterized protein n=1 Tax=Cacopsylla melanoneura TaxID=428564 RepID=A0A8D8VWD5_9HEMI
MYIFKRELAEIEDRNKHVLRSYSVRNRREKDRKKTCFKVLSCQKLKIEGSFQVQTLPVEKSLPQCGNSKYSLYLQRIDCFVLSLILVYDIKKKLFECNVCKNFRFLLYFYFLEHNIKVCNAVSV